MGKAAIRLVSLPRPALEEGDLIALFIMLQSQIKQPKNIFYEYKNTFELFFVN
jgi:hypothetical protein